jgi:hypothetical protein
MRHRFAIATVAVLAALMLVPVGALADGDPASDVLLGGLLGIATIVLVVAHT